MIHQPVGADDEGDRSCSGDVEMLTIGIFCSLLPSAKTMTLNEQSTEFGNH